MTGVSSLFVNNNSVLNAAVTNSGTGGDETGTGDFSAIDHQRQRYEPGWRSDRRRQ